jgi:ribosomal protein S18 acetylase RimI-like enzyme
MENIAVSRDHQRTGIGQSLMKKMMDLANEYPDAPIVLYVRAENAGAIALYTRFGFQITNTEKMVGNYAPEK